MANNLNIESNSRLFVPWLVSLQLSQTRFSKKFTQVSKILFLGVNSPKSDSKQIAKGKHKIKLTFMLFMCKELRNFSRTKILPRDFRTKLRKLFRMVIRDEPTKKGSQFILMQLMRAVISSPESLMRIQSNKNKQNWKIKTLIWIQIPRGSYFFKKRCISLLKY